MARKPRLLSEHQEGQEGAEGAVIGQLIPEADEFDKVITLMESISGKGPDEVTLYLHRAQKTNRALSGAMVTKYPSNTSIEDIYTDAQEKYGGGDFVLVARGQNQVLSRAPFSVEPLTKGEQADPAGQSRAIDAAMTRMAGAVEKATLIDRVAEITKPKPAGGDSGLSGIVQAMIVQNTELVKILLTKNQDTRDSGKDLMEAIKLGVSLADGKVPGMDREDDSLAGIVRDFMPILGKIVERAPAKAEAPRPVARPALKGAGPHPPGPPPPPAAMTAQEIVQSRVTDELLFCLTQPETERMYDHIASYLDSYWPGLLDRLFSMPEEEFISQVSQFHPTFGERADWFRRFYHHFSEEEPQGAVSPAPFVVVQPAAPPAAPVAVAVVEKTEQTEGGE